MKNDSRWWGWQWWVQWWRWQWLGAGSMGINHKFSTAFMLSSSCDYAELTDFSPLIWSSLTGGRSKEVKESGKTGCQSSWKLNNTLDMSLGGKKKYLKNRKSSDLYRQTKFKSLCSLQKYPQCLSVRRKINILCVCVGVWMCTYPHQRTSKALRNEVYDERAA